MLIDRHTGKLSPSKKLKYDFSENIVCFYCIAMTGTIVKKDILLICIKNGIL